MSANRQIAGLRGARRKAYDEFEQEVARTGCAALGYRLTGSDPLPRMCVKHLRGKDRAVVAFSADEVWVLLVGPHDEGDKVSNIYTALYDLAGVPRPMTPRTKPACCNPAGSPPLMDELLLDDLVMRARRLALRRG